MGGKDPCSSYGDTIKQTINCVYLEHSLDVAYSQKQKPNYNLVIYLKILNICWPFV
jgi:hypothetical protein